MSRLYSTLPHEVYTLNEFVQEADRIKDVSPNALVDFIITGQNMATDPPHQAVIDPLRNATIRDTDEILVLRDFDSALLPSPGIIVTCHIAVSPISNPADTLTKSIHLKYPIQRGNVGHIVHIRTYRN
jgi:hypothetical protein